MTTIALFVAIIAGTTLLIVVVAGWAMRHADDQEHMPRRPEVPAAFAPRSDGG